VLEQLEDRSVPAALTWDVQSDYFGTQDGISQTRSLRGVAVTSDGQSVIGAFIQGTSTSGLREVDSGILTTNPDTAVIGNFNGSGANPYPGNPVYTGGATGDLEAAVGTTTRPKSVDTDDRGYVYAAFESDPAHSLIIYNSTMTATVATVTGVSITNPTVSVQHIGPNYYAYLKTGTGIVQRYDVTNPASPTIDLTWGTGGIANLQSVPGWSAASVNAIYTDSDGIVYVAGGITVAGRDSVFRIPANGDVSTATRVSLNGAMDLAVFQDKLYVSRYLSTTSSIAVLNKADLSSAGADLTTGFTHTNTNSDSGYSGLAINYRGQIYVADQWYLNVNPTSSYTPPVTSFNPTPSAITGTNILFDRILVSSPLVTPSTVWVDGAWASLPNGTVVDRDPFTLGTQPATIGFDAFADTQAGINAVDTVGTVVVYTGNYTTAITSTKAVTLEPRGMVSLSGNLTLDSNDTLDVRLNGPVAGTQYDQIVVGGTTTLGSANLTGTLGYVPPSSGTNLTIIDGVTPVSGNFAQGSTITIGATAFNILYSSDVVLNIAPVNQAPTAISLSQTSLPENAGVNFLVGLFSTTDPDVGDTFTYTLVSGAGSGNNARFTIPPNTNELRANTSFNYEVNSTFHIRVRSTDSGGLTVDMTFVITVTDVNEAPTDITTTGLSVPENSPNGTVVGSVTGVDPDTSAPFNTLTYSLTNNAGGRFAINSSNGTVTVANGALLDYETNTSHTITVQVTDGGTPGLSYSKNFLVIVTNVNEAPTNITINPSSLPENAGANHLVGTFTTTDPDAGDSFTYSLRSGTGDTDNGSFTIVGDKLYANTSFDFETKSSYSIRVRSTDSGGLFIARVFTITVTDVNETPTNTVPGVQTVNEDTPLAFTGANSISVNNLDGASATVKLTVLKGTLTVSLAGGATISAGANGSATLTLSGNETKINAALATLTFLGIADYNGSDTLTVFSKDVDGDTDTDTVAITINPVSDIVNDNLLLNSINPITANLITGTNGASADTFSNPGRTLTSVTQPNKGTVTFLANGTITYTPFFAFTGTDTFTYTVTSAGTTETGTVTVGPPSQSTFLTASGVSGAAVKQFSVSALGTPATQTALSFTLTGASRVAYGDVNGDGVEDIIVGSVTGTTSIVRIYNGKTAALMNSFTPFIAGSVSGIFVAAGDVNGDGKADVTVTNGSLGLGANSDTRVYDGAYLASGKVVVSASVGGTVAAQGRLRDFYAFTNATGSSGNGNTFTPNTGATVAMGDFNGDGLADIVVGVAGGNAAGSTGRVLVFDSKVLFGSNAVTAYPNPNVDLVVYNPGSTTGVFVAAGDINGDGRADLVTSPVSGGPNIRVFTFAAGSKALPTSSYATFTNSGGVITTTTLGGTAPILAADFYVGAASNVGVRIATRDLNGDGYAEIVYTFGASQPGYESTYVGAIDGNSLRTAFASTPYQQKLAPPPGSDFKLLDAAYAGSGFGAYVA
jgi:hypothetical protein